MHETASLSPTNVIRPPSYLIEYGYYAVIFYAMLGQALGIVFPLMGAGMLAGLAMLCVMHFGFRSKALYGPIALALACAFSTLLLQLFVYQESPMNGDVRSYLTWALALVVIQAISMRPGFFHRFAIFAFFLGCATLPYLKVYVSSEELTRMGVSGDVGLANPNAFGMWFGFCSVYFIVRGLETQNTIIRFASWAAGLLSIFLVAITVSRGPLLGVAIATVVAFHKVLKRSFFPILLLLFLGWFIYLLGFFDQVIGYYTNRGAEESGRTSLWTNGLAKFLESWWLGVGISNAQVPLASGKEATPHNVLLYIGIQSGIVPLLFFVGYMARAGISAFRGRDEQTPDAPFRLPLYLFAFLEMMLQSFVFFSPWPMVTLVVALAAGQTPRVRQKTKGMAIGSNPVKNTGIS